MTLGIAWGQYPNDEGAAPIPLLPAEAAWIVTLPSPTSAGGAMDDRRVYVPLQNQQLVALDRETGREVWTRDIASAWPPLVVDDVVYLAGSDALHALDAATGEGRWRVPLEHPVAAPVAAGHGWLLTVAGNGNVNAYRASDGVRIWQQQMGAAPRGGVVFGDGGAVYVTLDDGRVGAMSLGGHGLVLWEQRLPGRLSAPAWAPDRVLVGSTDNHFYALDAESGSLEWTWRSGGDVIGAAADDDVVFIASLGNILRAVNRGNGNQRWRAAIGTRPAEPPQAFGGIVLVTGVNSSVLAFAADTGEEAGSYLAPGSLHGSPLVDPDLRPYRVAAAVVMRDGRVAGLRPVAMLFREAPRRPLSALPGRMLPRDTLPALSGRVSP